MAKRVKIKIKEQTSRRGMSLRELSRLIDIRHAALSELSNSKRQNINFQHIEKIAEALNITDIRDIIDLVEEP
ncbi:helix-turn-helix domain-containing protein [Cohnella soli]|uniref:Helix-turn-helix domain-containing protein n=1 Tax=Cohnella soli TaxID=425005 RepID=A0ABW0HZF9_9BACL